MIRGEPVAAVLRRASVACGVAAAVALSCNEVAAADAAKPAPSIWDQATLTGDWGGARTTLKEKQGIEITLNYINEVFGVASGGVARRANYEGQFEFTVEADLQRLAGWTGANAHVTVYQIHDSGHNVADHAGSFSDPSNIDALPTTRLSEAWFEQRFNNRVALRVGQLIADSDFFVSDTAGKLLNATFGWADPMSFDMLNGGPVYPLATPGARLKIDVTDSVTVFTGVFSGNPAGAGCDEDAQRCNRHGTAFNLTGGALWMGEVQFAVNQGEKAVGLPGVYKLGGWVANTDFPDQRLGRDAFGSVVSLGVDPMATPLQHRGDWGIYWIADQTIWRAGERSLSLFYRSAIAPSDRNLISYYADAGFGFTGLLPGRSADVLSFGVAFAGISHDAAAADRDALAISGPPYPIRDHELVFEASYQWQVAPWWIVQPDLQFIVHPGGNVPDPNDPAVTVGNAFIAGIRSTIKF